MKTRKQTDAGGGALTSRNIDRVNVRPVPDRSTPVCAAYTDPVTGHSGWSMAYSYDENSNLKKRIDARGATADYSYDALNRNYQIDYTNGSQSSTVLRSYDGAANGKGRLFYEYTLEGGGYVTHTAIDGYDDLGRPVQKRQHFFHGGSWDPAYLVQQTYDLAGNVKTVRYPSDHTVNYSYDQAGRLNSFSGNLGGSPKTYADTIGYNAARQMTKERFGTNTLLYHNSHYNNRMQLASTRVGDSATDEWNAGRGAITFYYGSNAAYSGDIFVNDTDNNGNLRRQINWVPLAGGGQVIPQLDDYTYDALNRIGSFTEAQRDSGGQLTFNVASQNYSYDSYGNRQITGATGGVNNYHPTYDQITNRISGGNYYDAAGNITTDPVTGVSMTYDAENRMLTATNGNYTYDADGRRVRRITGGVETWYVYGIGGELLAEYASAGAAGSPQKEYGYRGGQLLIIAENGSGGGSSFVKPAAKSNADLIAKKGSRASRATKRTFSLDKPYAAFSRNKGYGSITAKSSDSASARTPDRGAARTTAEEHANAHSGDGAGGEAFAEHPSDTAQRTPEKKYSNLGARSLSPVAMQNVVPVNPGANQTPDPGQGGLAVSGQSNLGHGDTYVQASGYEGGGNISQTKTCLWHSFANVSGQKTRVTLKFDWAQTGSIYVQNNNLGDNTSASTTLGIEYSTDNGANWTTYVSRYHFRFVIFGVGNDSELINDSGSESLDLPNPNTINITQIRVRDRIVAAASASGSGSADASVTMHISNIHLEVEIDSTPPVISNVAAGGITKTGATITWNTNENADSQVEYGTTGYTQSTALNPALVTAHSQGLSGLTPGQLYHYRVKSKDAGGNLAFSGDLTFRTLDSNEAAFVSQSVPATMTAGETYPVTVTMLNQGSTTWTPGQAYRLGSQNPQDNGTWGLGRVGLPGASVSPGATATFSFVVTAPSSPGSYNFQWRMVQDGVEWFGAMTPNVAVNVIAPDTTPPTVASFTPASGATTVNVNENVTVTFSEAMNTSTVNTSTIELRDSSNVLVPTSVSYNAATFTATLDPNAALAANTTYTVGVRGGSTDPRVKDLAGNALATDKTWTFTTAQSGSVAIKWLVQDHLGSTRMVIDETGSLAGIERHDYAPFGEELVAGAIRTGNGYGGDSVKQKFGSKERDIETGLDYFGERYYASTQGRFTTCDPLMASAKTGDPQSWNRYVYVLNNPLRYIDPDGMMQQDAWGQLTEEEQKIIAAKLNVKKGETAQKAFNDRFTGRNDKETAALVTSVKNLIDNAGGHSNSEVWQQIQSIDGGWVDKKNNEAAALTLSVKNSKDFLTVLEKNGYDVDKYYEIASDHKHSARFITETSYQPGMHLVQQDGYPDSRFDVHWDPRSSAFNKVSLGYYVIGAGGKDVERAVAGRTHENPLSSAQVRQELKRMGIVPRNEP